MPAKIVYVNEGIDLINLARLVLDRYGSQPYEVIGVTDGQKAMDVIKREQPDLVLTNLMLPRVDGWQVIHAMRDDDRTHHIPIIIITAKTDRDTRFTATKIEQVNDFIPLPYRPHELAAKVERVLDKK
jgi:DNA-binding response OmpR family regulator